jgi:hypothetical protein
VPEQLTGPSGSLLMQPQSFNETRALEITPTATVTVGSMVLAGLDLGVPGMVGARIYDAATQALVASGEASAGPGSNLTITVTISATLAAGKSYWAGFFVSDGGNGGSAQIYQNLMLPYTVGPFSVVAIGEGGGDVYPANVNIFAPQVTIQTCGP